MHRQIKGRFKHVSIDGSTDIANRVLQREGILDLETSADLEGASFPLRQMVGMDESALISIYSYKQLELYANHLVDDATYSLGDVCYIDSIRFFGIIRQLLKINDKIFADLQLYETNTMDPESNIPFSSNKLTDNMKVEPLCKLSEPLVTAAEDSKMRFVSYNGNDNFIWFSEHLKL